MVVRERKKKQEREKETERERKKKKERKKREKERKRVGERKKSDLLPRLFVATFSVRIILMERTSEIFVSLYTNH